MNQFNQQTVLKAIIGLFLYLFIANTVCGITYFALGHREFDELFSDDYSIHRNVVQSIEIIQTPHLKLQDDQKIDEKFEQSVKRNHYCGFKVNGKQVSEDDFIALYSSTQDNKSIKSLPKTTPVHYFWSLREHIRIDHNHDNCICENCQSYLKIKEILSYFTSPYHLGRLTFYRFGGRHKFTDKGSDYQNDYEIVLTFEEAKPDFRDPRDISNSCIPKKEAGI